MATTILKIKPGQILDIIRVLAQIPGKSDLKNIGGYLTTIDTKGNMCTLLFGRIKLENSLRLMDISIGQAARLNQGLISIRQGATKVKGCVLSIAASSEENDQAIVLLLANLLDLMPYSRVMQIAEANQNSTLRHFHYYHLS